MFKLIKGRVPRLSKTSQFIGLSTGIVTSILFTNSILLETDLKDVRIENKKISLKELAQHKDLDSGVWVGINKQVYNITDFIYKHPGGSKILLQNAGKDATKLFNQLHPSHVIETYLKPEDHVGELDIPDELVDEVKTVDRSNLPPLSQIFNIHDFEFLAKKILAPEAWAYYSGGSDDEITMRENHSAYQRIYFNPRVLVDVREIDISTSLLGTKLDAPFYVSAAALAKLGHPDGELSIARACAVENIMQMISSTASYSFDEITSETSKPKWFQLYVKPDRSHSYKMLEKSENNNIKAVFVTVDTPLLGRREKDYRFRYADIEEDVEEYDPIKDFNDPGLTWKDIDDFKSRTNLPIAIKGVQRVQDVLIAIDHKVDAVVLSNHGGRQLEYSKAPIEVLAELMPILREKKLDDKIDIFVDGGIRRGTDVVKALCLGAKGVGLGRPFLYSNAAYGEKGVRKAIQLLKNEIILTMKLLGVNKIEDLNEDLVDISNLKSRRSFNDLHNDLYEPLEIPKFKDQ